VSEHVKTELCNGVLVLTLQRPDKKNAITGAMYDALSDALDRAETDVAVKVVLFQGDGIVSLQATTSPISRRNPKAIATRRALLSASSRRSATRRSRLLPAVQGNAVGIGTTMLLHCDLVYLAEGARLVTPFVNLALVPEAASSWLLPARIGHVRAYQMFALGEPMDAVTAVACGLANAVVPAGEVRQKAMAAAVTLTKRPAGSLNATKNLMRDIERIQAQISAEGDLFKERLKTPEAREAFAAFAERRPPNFANLPA